MNKRDALVIPARIAMRLVATGMSRRALAVMVYDASAADDQDQRRGSSDVDVVQVAMNQLHTLRRVTFR
jgi:hypothetical protein